MGKKRGQLKCKIRQKNYIQAVKKYLYISDYTFQITNLLVCTRRQERCPGAAQLNPMVLLTISWD